MSEYAAFLRGMNVGGHRISNGELGRCFEELGFRDIGTFRASGNVIFAAGFAESIATCALPFEASIVGVRKGWCAAIARTSLAVRRKTGTA